MRKRDFERLKFKKDTFSFKKDHSALADYLSTINWDYWCTFTTAYPLSLSVARRKMERFHNLCNADQAAFLFWVAEPFDCREGFHTHGLLKCNNLLIKEALWDNWQHACGGKHENKDHRAQFKKYNPNQSKAVGRYCAKYITKGHSDYDFLTGEWFRNLK